MSSLGVSRDQRSERGNAGAARRLRLTKQTSFRLQQPMTSESPGQFSIASLCIVYGVVECTYHCLRFECPGGAISILTTEWGSSVIADLLEFLARAKSSPWQLEGVL